MLFGFYQPVYGSETATDLEPSVHRIVGDVIFPAVS